MTTLLDPVRFPVELFSNLYHRRWRIEEAFKRLKHRLNLEHVSGLSQGAVVQDVAAKVLSDNLQALVSAVAHQGAQLSDTLRINRSFALTVLTPALPALLLGHKIAKRLLRKAITLIATQTCRHRPRVSKPRPQQSKPHKYMTQKPC